ncbi:hypothetical protein EV641_110173 [Rhodococcus sp. SMB37]|nr:hypothetical protein EV641_110173 [Rhodococcus sp. SMB37]
MDRSPLTFHITRGLIHIHDKSALNYIRNTCAHHARLWNKKHDCADREDRVRIRPAGASVFRIVDVADEGRFVLESVDGIPEGYRFPMREEDLIPE